MRRAPAQGRKGFQTPPIPMRERGVESNAHRGQDRRTWFTSDDDQETDARGRPNRDTTTGANPSSRSEGRHTRRVKE